jgi:hypothetical protein
MAGSFRILSGIALLLLILVPRASAVGQQAAPADYIRVEIRGNLQTGIVAIGGESTGTVIRADNVTWELDLGGNEMLKAEAAALHKKKVVVTGKYLLVKGVEIPERHIVKVDSLKAAP